jgi:hypothetical protein
MTGTTNSLSPLRRLLFLPVWPRNEHLHDEGEASQ